MDEIALMPDPAGRWVMMCPCGASEIRADAGPTWHDFELTLLDTNRYRVRCTSCGRVTEHAMSQE